MRWDIALAVVVLSVSIPGVAAAQAGPAADTGAAAAPGGGGGAGNKVPAEDLYQQGLALMAAGKWAEAAAKLEESNRIDPAPGTSINLADCYEHMGKLASAWTLFVEAATIFGRKTPPDPRAETAKARAEALYPRLSRLTIEVPEAVLATPGLVVRRDGQELGAGQMGAAIAVDPEDHVIEASAPGRVAWSAKVKVEGEAKKVSVVVPALAEAGDGGGGAGAAGGGWPWQKKVAVGAAGVGVAGLVVGAVFGGMAMGNHEELTKRCAPGEPRVCDAEGVKIAGEQKTVATVSTVEFAAGGALIAAGVVLWLVAPSADGGAKTGRGSGVWIAPSVGGVTGLAAGGAW